jgi:hypothetical protein
VGFKCPHAEGLMKHLASQKFHEDKEVISGLTTWFHVQVAVLFDLRKQKLVPKLNKHHDTNGDYVEKQLRLKVCVKSLFTQFCQ